jgi:hypothetical protein
LFDSRFNILEFLFDILGDCNVGVTKARTAIDLALNLIHLSRGRENAEHGFLRFSSFKVNGSSSVLLNNAVVKVAGSMRKSEAIHSVIFKLYTMHEYIRRAEWVSSLQLVRLQHLNLQSTLRIHTHNAILDSEHPGTPSCRQPTAPVLLT